MASVDTDENMEKMVTSKQGEISSKFELNNYFSMIMTMKKILSFSH